MRVESLASSSTCAKNVSEVAHRCVFSMNRGSCCSKSRLAKAAGAEVAVRRTGEKWHAAVAKSTFESQNVQHTTFPEPFWKLRCSKIARGCGEKHIWKSKCAKHHIPGAILEVAMFKNCTRLWRKAHLKVKMCKTPHGRSHFGSSDVQKWHAAVARSIFVSQNVEKMRGTGHFLKVWCQKMARRCGAKHIRKSKCAKHLLFAPFWKVSNWLANELTK